MDRPISIRRGPRRHPIESPEHAIVAGYVFGLAGKHGLDLTIDLDPDGHPQASAVVELPGLSPGLVVRLVVDPPEAVAS